VTEVLKVTEQLSWIMDRRKGKTRWRNSSL